MEKGLKSTTVTLMIAVALFFDVLQTLFAFIYLGWAVGIFAGLTFWLWFRTHGISFIKKPSRLATFAITAVIETFPLLPTWVIPAWTAAVAYLAVSSKIKQSLPIVGAGESKTAQSTDEELDKAA